MNNKEKIRELRQELETIEKELDEKKNICSGIVKEIDDLLGDAVYINTINGEKKQIVLRDISRISFSTRSATIYYTESVGICTEISIDEAKKLIDLLCW